MSFWNRVFGGHRRRTAEPDAVYLTAAARWRGFVADVQSRRARGEIVLVAAWFPDLLRDTRLRLEQAGFGVHVRDEPLPASGVRAALGNLPPDALLVVPAPALTVDEADSSTSLDEQSLPRITILVPEMHPLESAEQSLLEFAAAVPGPTGVMMFASLDDPLMAYFAGDRVAAILRMLQLPEDERIESAMVSRQIRKAQQKLSQRVTRFEPADNAADWIARNIQK